MNPSSAIQSQRMACGLPVLAVARPGAQVVAVDAWVRAGSADEPARLGGISHFLEHMLFKGTEKWGVGEIDRAVEGVGGYLNAATSGDFTHFYIALPSDRLEMAVDILADVLRHSTLDSGELDSERQVILEEYNRKQDDPHGLIWELLYDTAFEQGPYKAPILGDPESLARIGRAEMLEYYRAHYTTDTIALVVVGDVEPGRAFAAAEAAFDGFARTAKSPENGAIPSALYAAGAREVREKEINETYGVLAFPSPALRDPAEAYALDVLQFVLGGGDASMLFQEIKEKRRLATSIYAGCGTSRYPDLFYVFYTCEEERREALESAVLDEIERVRQDIVSPAVLDRARRLLANAHLFSLETTSGQSSSIGFYHTVTGSPDFEWNYVAGVGAVSAEQVQEQAQKWLRREAMNAVALRPKA